MMRNRVQSILLILSFGFCLLLTGCDGNSEKNQVEGDQDIRTENTKENEDKEIGKEQSSSSTSKQTNEETTSSEVKTHSEYVETYSIYAEQGAVVTWYDSETGKYKYKGKCETCGKTESSEHTGLKMTTNGSKYTSTYNCSNSKCDMFGKSQKVIITCKAEGAWIEVKE